MRFIIYAQFRCHAFCPGRHGVIVDGVGCSGGAYKVFAAGAEPAESGPHMRQFKRIHARPFIEAPPSRGTIDFAVVRNGFLAAAPTLREPLANLIPFPERARIGKLVKIPRQRPIVSGREHPPHVVPRAKFPLWWWLLPSLRAASGR